MFKQLNTQFKQLCSPSRLYVTISLVSVFIVLLQNISQPRRYCLGNYSCDLGFPNALVFIGKILYVAVWAVILDSLCKNGFERLSWFLVLLPYVLLFVLLGLFMFTMMLN